LLAVKGYNLLLIKVLYNAILILIIGFWAFMGLWAMGGELTGN